MDWSTAVSTLIGVIAGGLINTFFSQRGSKELRREADNLKQLTTRATQFHEFVPTGNAGRHRGRPKESNLRGAIRC